MKGSLLTAAVAAVALLAGGSAAWAGGEQCRAAHTEADYQKMAEKMAAKGWLGIDTEKTAAGYAVKAVVAGSPAERAGFQKGDVLVALNGVKLGDESQKDALYKVKSELGPGKSATYTVTRYGSEKAITATYGEVPRDVLAQWLGEHVLEHTTVAVAAVN
jgi:S1-C subfamily serine protease